MNIKQVTKPLMTLTVDKTSDIFLDITIGNAQIGGSTVRFINNTALVGKGAINNLNLGLGQSLVGQTIEIITNVLDVNNMTNGIVITHFFHNATPALVPFNDTVDAGGDIYSLTIQYSFA